jgi:hypothetical protein
MSETEKARVPSTRGRRSDQSFLFDDTLTYPQKLEKCLDLTQKEMQEIAARHCGHAVALKLERGLSSSCCASMQQLIPNSEHYIKDLHQKAAQYVQHTTTEQPPLLPINPHVFYVDTQTAPGVIVQAKDDLPLQLDNATFNPGELHYEDGTAFGTKRSLPMEKQMCKLTVYWGVLGFNVRVVCLRRREGVEAMTPEVPRPSIQSYATQEMANIFSRAMQKRFFRSEFKIPKENTTPISDCTQLKSKLEQKLGVRFPAKASEQRLDGGARSAQADRGEPPRTYYFLGMPEQGSGISEEERYDDMQQSKDRGGNGASGACCTAQKTAQEEEEDELVRFILENGAQMDDGAAMEHEDNSWYNQGLGYSDDEDVKGSVGGESSEQAGASSTDWGILDGASLVEGLTFPPASGTPDAQAQMPEGGSTVEVPTASDAKSSGDARSKTRMSLKTGTTKATGLSKTKKKGLHAQGANPEVSTEVERKHKAGNATKRQREESTLGTPSPAKKKTTASANMHVAASQCASDDSLHAVEPLLNSGVRAKAPRSTAKEKDSRIERMLVGGFV